MADEQPIIIKKIKKRGGHGAHGGAWKIAYADFVTAMMAFFLLMWLLANTTKEQKEGLAEYFSPSTASQSTSGAGQVLGGQSVSKEGTQAGSKVAITPAQTTAQPQQTKSDDDAAEDQKELDEKELKQRMAAREERMFDNTEKELRKEVQKDPELSKLYENLIIDRTPEGMRIQLVDSENRSMFAKGSTKMHKFARKMLKLIARVIDPLPNRLKIAGHTDARGYITANGYGNWELSADRANASRRVLRGAGLAADRFFEVTGKADTEPLFPDRPKAAPNRRISIILMREAPVLPPE